MCNDWLTNAPYWSWHTIDEKEVSAVVDTQGSAVG